MCFLNCFSCYHPIPIKNKSQNVITLKKCEIETVKQKLENVKQKLLEFDIVITKISFLISTKSK